MGLPILLGISVIWLYLAMSDTTLHLLYKSSDYVLPSQTTPADRFKFQRTNHSLSSLPRVFSFLGVLANGDIVVAMLHARG